MADGGLIVILCEELSRNRKFVEETAQDGKSLTYIWEKLFKGKYNRPLLGLAFKIVFGKTYPKYRDNEVSEHQMEKVDFSKVPAGRKSAGSDLYHSTGSEDGKDSSYRLIGRQIRRGSVKRD